MGRGLVIITTAMVFIFGIIQLSIVNRANVETGINIDYGTWSQARNVASSGLEVAIMELTQEATWRPANDLLEFQLDGVLADVVVIDPAADSTLPANRVRIVSEATMGRRTARINAIMQRGGNIPTIEGAVGIYTEDAVFRANGTAFLVSGTDAQTDDELMKYGIATGESVVYDKVLDELNKNQQMKVQGKGGTPSVGQVTNINEELIELAMIYKEVAQNAEFYGVNGVSHDELRVAGGDSLGSINYPQITYIDKKMTITGNASGAGVLVLGQDATLDMTGGGSEPFNFYGLVIVLGSAKIQGNMDVQGAMMFGGRSESTIEVTTGGNIEVKYSSAAMEFVKQFLDTSGYDFNRSFRLVSIYE
jgi:hypothetical protein